MKEYFIGFSTNGGDLDGGSNVFGSSVHSFASDSRWIGPEDNAFAFWDRKLKGKILAGNYQSVIKRLLQLDFKPKLCIVYLYKTDPVDYFINQFCQIMPDIPIIGGGVVRFGEKSIVDLNLQSEDLSLFAVAEGNFTLHSLNIYNKTNISVEIKKTTNRKFELLRVLPNGKWQFASEFYHFQQEIRSIRNDNFEYLTFCDKNERNIHCSIEDNSLKSGANLPDDNILFLREITFEEAENRLLGFISGNNSLIFGCAGIRSLIRNPQFTGKHSLAGFVFGELVTINNHPMFGNLMLTKLVMQ